MTVWKCPNCGKTHDGNVVECGYAQYTENRKTTG